MNAKRKADDLRAPDGLTALGAKAHRVILKILRQHRADTCGCRAFYSPGEWAARGEKYGTGSQLVVVYDGSDLSEFFNLDSAPSSHYEKMRKALKEIGLYTEECTGWYSAVYEIRPAAAEPAAAAEPTDPVPPPTRKTCGNCSAGILLMGDGHGKDVIKRCDDCALFGTDQDAQGTVRALMRILHAEYLRTDTVAAALERLRGARESRDTGEVLLAALLARVSHSVGLVDAAAAELFASSLAERPNLMARLGHALKLLHQATTDCAKAVEGGS